MGKLELYSSMAKTVYPENCRLLSADHSILRTNCALCRLDGFQARTAWWRGTDADSKRPCETGMALM